MNAPTDLATVDDAVAAARYWHGRPPAPLNAPGGPVTDYLLARLYADPAVAGLPDPQLADEHIAMWVTWWLHTQQGVYASASAPEPGDRHWPFAPDALSLYQRTDTGWHAQLVGAMLHATSGEHEPAAVVGFAAALRLAVSTPAQQEGLAATALARRGIRAVADPAAVDAAERVPPTGDSVFLRAVVAAIGSENPAEVARLLSERGTGTWPVTLVAMFGYRQLWDSPHQEVLAAVVDTAVRLTASLVPKRPLFPVQPPPPGRRLTTDEQRFLAEIVVTVTRVYLASVRSGIGERLHREQFYLNLRLVEVLKVWATDPPLQAATRWLWASIRPDVGLFVHTVFADARVIRRKSRVQACWYSVGLAVTAVGAYGFGTLAHGLPEWVTEYAWIPLFSGAIFGARRISGFRGWYRWPAAVTMSALLLFAYWVGIVDPDSAVFRGSTYTGFGELSGPMWAVIAAVALLGFSALTRSPFTRFVFRWTTFDSDEALPPDVEDLVDETMNETIRQIVE